MPPRRPEPEPISPPKKEKKKKGFFSMFSKREKVWGVRCVVWGEDLFDIWMEDICSARYEGKYGYRSDVSLGTRLLKGYYYDLPGFETWILCDSEMEMEQKVPCTDMAAALGRLSFPPIFLCIFWLLLFFVVGKLHMLEWRTNDILGREQILFIIIVHIKLIYLDWILMGILEGLAC
jgi:hypothetical protein